MAPKIGVKFHKKFLEILEKSNTKNQKNQPKIDLVTLNTPLPRKDKSDTKFTKNWKKKKPQNFT